jgi:hypothetical protein
VKRNLDIPTSEKKDMKPVELIKASAMPDSSQRNREGMCEIRRSVANSGSTIRVSGYVMRWMASAKASAAGGSCSR